MARPPSVRRGYSCLPESPAWPLAPPRIARHRGCLFGGYLSVWRECSIWRGAGNISSPSSPSLRRSFGKASNALAPVMILSILLLAHDRIRNIPADLYALQTYILWLQLSLAFLFALSYGLAI